MLNKAISVTGVVVLALALFGCSAADNGDDASGTPAATTSSEAVGSATQGLSGDDPHRIESTCLPSTPVSEINTNENFVDEVLDEYPSEWTDNIPTPDVEVDGVCHEHLSNAGVKDVWWIVVADPDSGYQSALAWQAQLLSAGATQVCQPGRELETMGSGGGYSCSYGLAGYDAHISKSFGPIQFMLQPSMG